MHNIKVDWESNIPNLKAAVDGKRAFSIVNLDHGTGKWTSVVTGTPTDNLLSGFIGSPFTIDKEASVIYVRYLIGKVNSTDNNPEVTIAVLKELEDELAPYAPQPIQKLAETKAGWIKYMSGALKERNILRNKKSDILDEIAKKYK